MVYGAQEHQLKRNYIPFATVTSAVIGIAMTLAIIGVNGQATASATSNASSKPQSTTQQAVSYIDQRYASDATFRAVLGAPQGQEQGTSVLKYKDYENGRAYWTPASGVHEVHGVIGTKYLASGSHPVLGEPTNDETSTPDGVGKYNHFKGGSNGVTSSIYWTATTGAQLVQGQIRDKWAATAWERGPLGYPTTSQITAGDGVSKYSNFQQGTIYWSSAYGAQAVVGRIYQKWGDYQFDAGALGKPVTSELGTPDGVGRYNVFQGGSVYWSPSTDAHSVGGAIRDRYRDLGWERSYLGYPTTDEFSINNGRQSNFQHGFITWNATTGQVNDYRY
jgi:uncharacterized protein with LGFP repeats